MTRVMGLILSAIAVEFIANGLKGLSQFAVMQIAKQYQFMRVS